MFDFFRKIISKLTSSGPVAYYGGGRDSGGKYDGGMAYDSPTLTLDHFKLRQQARLAYHESLSAHAIVDSDADIVVGEGLKLEMAIDAEMLGLTDEQAEMISTQIENRFDEWAKSKKSDRSETNNFYQNQRLYKIFDKRDGEIFTRLYYSKDNTLLNPLQISFIDPNQIRGYSYTSTMYDYGDDDGIIRDAAGKEIAYRIWVKAQDGNFSDVTVQAKGPKSGRVFMLHGYTANYAGQRRGYTKLAVALQEFQDLTGLSSATIQKAINQASINMYTKPAENKAATNPFEHITGGAGPSSRSYGSNPAPSPTNTTPTVDYCPIPEATLKQPGVGVFNLSGGEDLKPFPETSPGDSYAPFVESFMDYICAAMGDSREVVLKKFGENYSASRATLILVWRTAVARRQEMASDFLDPVFEMWFAEEVAAGRISVPGWSDPRLRAAWLKHKWKGASMPNIDPQKSAKAIELYAGMGLTDLDYEASNYNGSDGKSNRRKLTKQYSELPIAPFSKNAQPEPQGDQ